MTEAIVMVEGRPDPVHVSVNGQNPTFTVATDPIRAAVMSELEPRLLDLLGIAATVFSLDGTFKRGGHTRPSMGRGWRRHFDISMSVRHPEIWSAPEVCEALENAVGFLTEDTFRFRFHHADPDIVREPFLDLDPTGVAFTADDIILFSGGLDSFAGALEVLSSTSSNAILVTHRSAQKAIPRQVQLGEYLSRRFEGRVLHIHVRACRAGGEADDSSQRSRSFLFAALAQLVASAFGARRISFFENGIISQNLPLTPQIVGSMATRTTHPLALKNLNRLMQAALVDPTPIENRYQWLTKTEVVRRIAENGGEGQIARAVSCTSVREQTTRHTHCGACSQCMDRRFAILAANLEAHDFAEDYLTDVLFGARETDHSRTMALSWTRHCLRLSELDSVRLMDEFGLEISRIILGHDATLAKTVVAQTRDMHHRHSVAIRGALQRIVKERSEDLLAAKLPPTSLLVMLLGQVTSTDIAFPVDPRNASPVAERHEAIDDVDIVPDPDGPLHVAFMEEDGKRLVAIRGLGRLTGRPALIPHALKPVFDEDREDLRAPKDHRYVPGTKLPLLDGMSKDAIRASVHRCRVRLAKDFEAVHGSPPGRDLLIQSRPPRGIRLDPLIQVIDPNCSD